MAEQVEVEDEAGWGGEPLLVPLTMNAWVGVDAQPAAVCPGPGGIPLGPPGLPPVRGHPRGLHTGRPVAGRGAGDPIRALRSGESGLARQAGGRRGAGARLWSLGLRAGKGSEEARPHPLLASVYHLLCGPVTDSLYPEQWL